jgi:hypothetical protein
VRASGAGFPPHDARTIKKAPVPVSFRKGVTSF